MHLQARQICKFTYCLISRVEGVWNRESVWICHFQEEEVKDLHVRRIHAGVEITFIHSFLLPNTFWWKCNRCLKIMFSGKVFVQCRESTQFMLWSGWMVHRADILTLGDWGLYPKSCVCLGLRSTLAVVSFQDYCKKTIYWYVQYEHFETSHISSLQTFCWY